MLAPIRPDQQQRLETIRRYGLGTRVHAGTFDGIVELAAQITGCEIALVTIVHGDMQSLEATRGIDPVLAEAASGLDVSICSHAILLEHLLEIPDMRLDPRTRDNVVVTGPDPLLYYAGAQIFTRTGLPLGTVCVLDRTPRILSDDVKRSLALLAEQVMRQLELHEALVQQDAMRREVDHRVKNSLANVAAMTRMAARDSGPEVRDILREVANRIGVMVELHADLYRVDDPNAPVEVVEYLTRIAAHLREMAPGGVTIETRFDPIALISRRASALGVLVNELIANACKHAFPEGRSGRIVLTGRIAGEGRYAIACEDDGIGPTGGVPTGLGSRIMEASAAQLDGFLRVNSGTSGYLVTLDFPLSFE